MNKTIKYLATAILYAIAAQTFAQNGVNSPYSRYGFGMMNDGATGFNKGMGGVAQGFRNGSEINVANPASYSAIDSLTALFDFGLSAYNGNYKMGKLQQNARNTSFDYLTFQFRACKGVGVTLGVLPYTNISYSFASNSEALSGNETVTTSYKFDGSGGLHQVFIGAGWKPFKPLSIGANVSYLYGDYSHVSVMSLSDNSAYSLVRGYSANIATYQLDFGLQYELKLSDKDMLTVGLGYGLGHDINNRAYRNTQSILSTTTTTGSTTSVQGVTTDTLTNAFQMPHRFSAGLTYSHGTKWRVGADVLYEKWGDARFPAQSDDGTTRFISTTGQLNDRFKIAVGGDFTPSPYSNRLLKRLTYKFGGYYSNTYAKTDSKISDKPVEYGLTAGCTIPIQNRNLWINIPKINVSVGWTHSDIPYISSATQQQSSLKENYLKVSLGITFSERWFYKWKVK